jgi:hypothetical protein
MKRSLSGSLVVALLLSTSACSVADYQQPITTFATATKNADSALSTLNTEVTSAYTALLHERAVSGEALVEVVPDDCLASSAQCRLDLLARDGQTQPLTPPPALRNMMALMGSISAYADNLEAVVSADTAAEVTTNVNATIGSIENLADTVEQAGGSSPPVDLSAYTTPAGEAVTWIVGQYAASVKIHGLRRATSEAQPVIAAATEVFEKAAETAALVPRATMSGDVEQQLAAFQANRSQANLDKLIQSASQFNAFLEAKPADVFAKMDTAHETLTRELQGDASLAEAIARIEAFASEAQRLADVAKAFAAAAQTGS